EWSPFEKIANVHVGQQTAIRILLLPPPLLPKQGLRPLRIVGSKSRLGVLAVVDILTVAARLVAFVDQRLQVKRDVGISPAEGNPNRRQALAEGNSVILDLKRFPAPAGAGG